MDLSEMEEVERMKNPDTMITWDATPSLHERTLLCGVTTQREVFHVYLKDRLIHRLIYRSDTDQVIDYAAYPAWNANRLVPEGGMVHPEYTSGAFARELAARNVEFEFGPYFDHLYCEARRRDFQARTKEEF
jgi:hypothetical protein